MAANTALAVLACVARSTHPYEESLWDPRGASYHREPLWAEPS